jgi:hypothetical protein
VLSEITIFHRLSFYAPRDLASKFVYVSDPALQLKHLGHSTIDRGFLDLRPWLPLNIVPWGKFLRLHPNFLSYGYVGSWTWHTYEFSHPPFETILVARKAQSVLLYVNNKGFDPVASGKAGPLDTPRLFDKLPKSGPSLCRQYMSDGDCPELLRERKSLPEQAAGGESSDRTTKGTVLLPSANELM